MPETVAVEPTPRFLLVKRGLYYGPDNRGYTGIKERAGRYFETDASPEDGITAIHEDDAQMFAPACFEDIKIEYLLGLLQSSSEQVRVLREVLERLRDLPIKENDEPDTLHLDGAAHRGPVVDWTLSFVRKVKEVARQALKDTM